MAVVDLKEGAIQTEGFAELQKKLGIVLPKITRKMAFTVDAKLAETGRKIEQDAISELEMGEPQKKSNKWHGWQVRSRWDSKRGWVSTTRLAAAKIGGQFSMSHFSFRGNKKNKGFVTAEYTNQVANLWGHRTKPYENYSPAVGQDGFVKRYKPGETREKRVDWSKAYRALASMESTAIAKTEAQYKKEFEEM